MGERGVKLTGTVEEAVENACGKAVGVEHLRWLVSEEALGVFRSFRAFSGGGCSFFIARLT